MSSTTQLALIVICFLRISAAYWCFPYQDDELLLEDLSLPSSRVKEYEVYGKTRALLAHSGRRSSSDGPTPRTLLKRQVDQLPNGNTQCGTFRSRHLHHPFSVSRELLLVR